MKHYTVPMLTDLFGSPPVEWFRATGGYSIAERWSVTLEDGRDVFAKMAPTDDIAEPSSPRPRQPAHAPGGGVHQSGGEGRGHGRSVSDASGRSWSARLSGSI